jgi:hypothetical protein
MVFFNSFILRAPSDDDRWQENDAIQKYSDLPPQSCVFDFVNLRASAENVDLNGCIVGMTDTTRAVSQFRCRIKKFKILKKG